MAMTKFHSGLPDKAWDQTLTNLDGSFLQSSSWAKFQQKLGRQIYYSYDKNWSWLAVLRRAIGLRYLLLNYGPTATSKAAMSTALDSIISAGRELKVDFVRVEPRFQTTVAKLQRLGGVKIADVEPEHSWLLDLSPDEASLRSGMHSGHRNLINGTAKRGIKIFQTSQPADVSEFLKMLKDTAKNSHVTFYPDSYFAALFKTLAPLGAVKLYLAKVHDQPVAGALFYDFNGVRTYAYAGAYQSLNRRVKASVSLVWQAILDAKSGGMKTFDFWGVAPTDDPNHPWAGISAFKKAFGGRMFDYLGTWDIPLKPAKYKAYSLYRKLRRR